MVFSTGIAKAKTYNVEKVEIIPSIALKKFLKANSPGGKFPPSSHSLINSKFNPKKGAK